MPGRPDTQSPVLSEYGMTKVSRPVYLNRVLREAGYVRVQQAQNGELLEPGASRAFAACSHQVAHVYVARPEDLEPIRKLLEKTDGVEQVLDLDGKKAVGLDHPRSGELIAVAAPDSWFTYPYWLDDAQAPDFAHCVAIHDKPGHDPVEMFLADGPLNGKLKVFWRLLQSKLRIRSPFDVISLDESKVRGSHGRLPDREQDASVLLSSWPIEMNSPVPMTSLKELFCSRVVANRS